MVILNEVKNLSRDYPTTRSPGDMFCITPTKVILHFVQDDSGG
jgi:hypothetical protein